MSETLNVNIVTYQLETAIVTGDGFQALVLKAPISANGGAIRIIDAYVVNGAVTTAGTGWSMTLQNRGTTGVVSAVAMSTLTGGTGSPFALNTPQRFTITNPILKAGEWLGFVKNQTNTSAPVNGQLVIHYLNGV